MRTGLGAGQLGRLEDQLLQAVHGLLQPLPRHGAGGGDGPQLVGGEVSKAWGE